MTLAISGKQDLNQLESWTKKFFSDIPNKKAPSPADEYWGKIPPFLPQKVASVLEVVPVGESRRISLCWPIWIKDQAERDVLLKTKPEQVVAHLIGHEGKGSVRSLLVAKGWGNSVQAAVTNDITDMQMVRTLGITIIYYVCRSSLWVTIEYVLKYFSFSYDAIQHSAILIFCYAMYILFFHSILLFLYVLNNVSPTFTLPL